MKFGMIGQNAARIIGQTAINAAVRGFKDYIIPGAVQAVLAIIIPVGRIGRIAELIIGQTITNVLAQWRKDNT